MSAATEGWQVENRYGGSTGMVRVAYSTGCTMVTRVYPSMEEDGPDSFTKVRTWFWGRQAVELATGQVKKEVYATFAEAMNGEAKGWKEAINRWQKKNLR